MEPGSSHLSQLAYFTPHGVPQVPPPCGTRQDSCSLSRLSNVPLRGRTAIGRLAGLCLSDFSEPPDPLVISLGPLVTYSQYVGDS